MTEEKNDFDITKCACYYWKCSHYDHKTEKCNINNNYCFVNRMKSK